MYEDTATHRRYESWHFIVYLLLFDIKIYNEGTDRKT